MKLPFRIRQSTLTVAQCLYRLKHTIVDGRREPESEFARRGTDFHALAKRYIDFLVSTQQEMDWSYADELCVDGAWNAEAIVLFKQWAQRRVFQPARVFATEFPARLNAQMVPCDDNENVVYSGDIDLLEMSGEEAEIIDFKTYFQVVPATSIQAIFYPIIVFSTFRHINKVTFTLEFVRYGISRSRTFSRDDLPTLKSHVNQQIARVATALEQDEWPAAANSGCLYCRLECPLVKAGMSRLEIGQVQDGQEAAQLANELYALDRQRERINTTLKNWAANNGPIGVGNNIQMGFAKQEKYQYDVPTIVKLNQDHGFDSYRALQVAPREVKRIGKSYKEYETAAQAAAKDRSSTKFTFWNTHGDPIQMESEEDE